MDRLDCDDRQFVTPLSYLCPVCQIARHLLIQHPWWICPDCETRFVPADMKSLTDDGSHRQNGPQESAVPPAIWLQ